MLAGAIAGPVATALSRFIDPALPDPPHQAEALTAWVDAALAPAMFTVNFPAGPLADAVQAKQVGSIIAAAHFGRYTGVWHTVVPGKMSLVEVELAVQPAGESTYTMDVPAGPLRNDDDAKLKCPSICASYGGTWNGQWTPIIWGSFSVAGCVFQI